MTMGHYHYDNNDSGNGRNKSNELILGGKKNIVIMVPTCCRCHQQQC